VQLVAFFEADQLTFVRSPYGTGFGLARRAPAVGGAITFTVTDFEIKPPAPRQFSVYVVARFIGAGVSDPKDSFTPVHPPDAVQESVAPEDHDSVGLVP
jgi:hypothetical protein